MIKKYETAMSVYTKKYSLSTAKSKNYKVTKDKYDLYTVSCEYRMPTDKNNLKTTVYYNAIYLHGTTAAWEGNYNSLAKTANRSEAFMQGFISFPDDFFMLIFIVELIIIFAGILTASDNEANFYKNCFKKSINNGGEYGIIQTFSKITYSGTTQSVKYIISH